MLKICYDIFGDNMKIKLILIIIIIVSIFTFFSFKYKEVNINTFTTKKDKSVKEIKLTLVGDFLFEDHFYNAVSNGYDKNNYFRLVKDYFQNDDISIGNMEVVIGNDNLKPSGAGYNFCAPSYIGDLVSSLDLEILSTANNHAFDRGIDGINSTLNYFQSNSDIKTVGTYLNEKDRENYRILEKNGIKVGFLAYTYGTNQKIDSDKEHLIAYYKDPSTKEIKKDVLEKEINKIKKESDLLIVLMHWGKEFTFTSNKEQQDLAKYLNSLGVDIIVGSHSHSIQPIEIIGDEKKTLVYYSLGNFTSSDDDIARTPKGEETFDNAYQFGLLSTLTIQKDKDNIIFKDIKAIPIINYFDTNLNNFLLIPYHEYSEEYEKKHYRYSYGLTKDFIKNTYESVIDKEYQQ